MYTIDRSANLWTARAVLSAVLVLGAAACSSVNDEAKGAVIGGVAGGVAGGVIGHQSGKTTLGAIIGAVVGGTAGAVIGHQMDQQAKELQQNIPGATVTRVGEGITVSFASGLLYGFDSSTVRAASGINLSNLASSLDKYPNTDLLIVGYTDAVGTSAYNQNLSEERATSAKNYLASQGVALSRMQATGRGETEPLSTADTEAARQLNRRVEIAIFANAATRK